MNDPIEYIEPPELELTDQDQADLEKLLTEQPEQEYHTILKVWKEVLKPENRKGSASDITMQWANGIVTKYAGIGFGDMVAYRDAYFALFDVMYDVLLFEIEQDVDCFEPSTKEEDVENNGYHYLNLLREWQLAFLRKELEWDCTAPTAAVDIAALAEVHGVFFGPTGLTGHLEAIQFEFTESDQGDLAAALQELRENFHRVEGR